MQPTSDDEPDRGLNVTSEAGLLVRPGAGSRWQFAARLALSGLLLALGLHVLSNYLRALIWAVVLAIALWPSYERVRQRAPRALVPTVLPVAFAALVAVVFMLPFLLLAVEAVREAHDIAAYSRQIEQSGIPVPDVVARLPYGAQRVGEWWNANLAHAGWFQDLTRQINTSANRELGRNVGVGALHRIVLFFFAILTLFFLFRDGEALVAQALRASEKCFGPHGERLGRQMVASIHGTVNGLVLVGIGEGVVLGIVYHFTGVPHPVLFGAVTAIAAMIPFAAAIVIALAAVLLLASGAIVPAVIVVIAGFLVTFTADHAVRPTLIGGSTKLPFLFVLLGILGGVESFGLLGLFVGPAIMAALVLLWRELTAPTTVVAAS